MKKSKSNIILKELANWFVIIMISFMFLGNLFLFAFFVYIAVTNNFGNNIINAIFIFLIFNVYAFASMLYEAGLDEEKNRN